MTNPTIEPRTLRAGDTWKWRREDLADYPAPTWTLKYRFKSAAGGFEVVAAASGALHQVTVAASTTAGFAAGTYSWAAWVESGAEQYTVGSGTVTIEPNLRAGAATDALDARSHARKVLAAIEAVLEGRASRDQEEYRIGDRMLKRTPIADLLRLRALYRKEVAAEDAAAAIANGTGTGRRILTRFSGVR